MMRSWITRGTNVRALFSVLLLSAAAVVASSVRAEGDAAPSGIASVRIPESIPVRRALEQEASGPRSLRALVIGLTLVVTLTVLTLKWRKPGGSARGTGNGLLSLLSRGQPVDGIRVLQSVRLTPRSTLHVIRWDGKDLIVGCAEGAIAILGSRTPRAEDTSAAEAGRTSTGGAP
jgi:hypothetical protein